MKKNTIIEVTESSIANEIGIVKGDVLISINNQPLGDIIDYLFLTSDEYIELEVISGETGETIVYEIEKEYDEDLGISFGNPLLDEAKSCSNQCIFCFVDQLPSGMRESLYFKDDDSRLSFMQGNFVTLTNLNYEQLDRIIRYRISPINVSVHTTDPELRKKILGNKHAGDVLEKMKRLAKGHIDMNGQIVLMPEINDGEGLDTTLRDLSEMHPYVGSVAMVPIGLSRFRDGLQALRPYSADEALLLVNQVDKIQEEMLEKLGTRFAFLSDEFFLLAGKELPDAEWYEGYIQVENGVGLIRKFTDGFINAMKKSRVSLEKRYLVLTGVLAHDWLKNLIESEGIDNLDVKAIKNDFFGQMITVSGLVTGTDIIKQVGDLSSYEGLVIPDVMLKNDEPIFLDDLTLDELSEQLGIKIYPVEAAGESMIKLLEELK
jgi:putative radical SAM enzyme (TIGR03279 family)